MSFQNLENFLANLNFLLLFFTIIFYFLQSALLLSSKWFFLPNTGIKLSSFLQTTFLGLRWFTSGHFPLSNLYESLIFLSWVLTSFLIFLNSQVASNFINKRAKNKITLKESPILIHSFLGSLLTPLILLVNTFASFSLPTELKLTSSLVPALKSNWLMMHVTFMVLSYGALLCGCLFAIAFLLIPVFLSFENKTRFLTNSFFEKGNLTQNLEISKQPLLSTSNFFSNSIKNFKESQSLKEAFLPDEVAFVEKKNFGDQPQKLLPPQTFLLNSKNYDNFIENLDNLSYRIIGFGFPLLTIGILSGAVWANQTWGSYWSWDPKETWALITWLIFAIYLHTRLSKGWSGQQSAFIAAFGFIIIWICYLGVNLMGKGLHSYGFFN
uniref:Cytochrome c biogenesis protein CcsA n=1 Tax=Gloeotilopsis planctonica TaxID=34157 RepID=A0A1B2RZ19_9CHLO|nr:heme attachment to plastid cytochrome c [Gloeotilopsis planctonica]